MKAFYLAGSILFTVLILILSFENIGTSCTNFLFLFFPVGSTFLISIGLAIIGVFAGVFYTAFFMQLIKSKSEDEEAGGAEF